MMNLVKTLFKAKSIGKTTEVTRDKKIKPVLGSASKVSPRKYDDLILSPNHSNYGVEVREISIIEFERRKKPR